MLCIFLNAERGRVEPVTTDLLSPKRYDLSLIGTPKYLKVCLKSNIYLVEVLDGTNSELYVAVSTVACLLEYVSKEFGFQSVGDQ